jgi:hypothetical protein
MRRSPSRNRMSCQGGFGHRPPRVRGCFEVIGRLDLLSIVPKFHAGCCHWRDPLPASNPRRRLRLSDAWPRLDLHLSEGWGSGVLRGEELPLETHGRLPIPRNQTFMRAYRASPKCQDAYGLKPGSWSGQSPSFFVILLTQAILLRGTFLVWTHESHDERRNYASGKVERS